MKVQLTPRDGSAAVKQGWIACAIGDGPAKAVSAVEWVIFRKAENDGWATFDLYLPAEVESSQFGQKDGLKFGGLVAIRLRGQLSVSPLEFYESAEQWDLTH